MPANAVWRRALRVIGAALGLWIFLRYLFGLFAPFFLALLLAAAIEYPVRLCTVRLHLPRAAASGLCAALLFAGMGFGFYWLLNALFGEVQRLSRALPETAQLVLRISSWFDRISLHFVIHVPEPLRAAAKQALVQGAEALQAIPSRLFGALTALTGEWMQQFPSALLFFVTALTATYFFSSDLPKIRQTVAARLPARYRSAMQNARKHTIRCVLCYLRAECLLAGMTALILTAGFCLLRSNAPLFLGVLTALIDALPVFGAGAVLLPWALFCLITGELQRAIWLAVLYALCAVLRSLAEPKLLGRELGLPPLVTLLASYVGLKLFGFWGLFCPFFLMLAAGVTPRRQEFPS